LLALLGMLCLIFAMTESQLWLSLFILGCKYGISQVFNIAYFANIMIFPTAIVA